MNLRQKLRRDIGKREILIWFLLNCQEIEELRRICCEETDRARQARIDELYCASSEESYDCESIVDSNSGFTEQSKFLVGCKRIFTI